MAAPEVSATTTSTGKSYKKADRKLRKSTDTVDEVTAALRSKYDTEYGILRPVFPEWKEADLLAILEDVQGDIHLASNRISEGFAEQWSDVSSQKRQKKPVSSSPGVTVIEPSKTRLSNKDSLKKERPRTAPASRGGRGGFKGSRGRGGFSNTRSTRQESAPQESEVVSVATVEIIAATAIADEPAKALPTNSTASAAPPVKLSWAAVVKPAPVPAPVAEPEEEPIRPSPKKKLPKNAKPATTPKEEAPQNTSTTPIAQSPSNIERQPVSRASPEAVVASPLKSKPEAAKPERAYMAASASTPAAPPGLTQKSEATGSVRKILKQEVPVVMPQTQQARPEVSSVEMQFGSLRLGEHRPTFKEETQSAVATAAPSAAPASYTQFGNQILGGALAKDSAKLNYLKQGPQQPQSNAPAASNPSTGHSAGNAGGAQAAATGASAQHLSSHAYNPPQQSPAAMAAAAAAYGMPQYGYYPYANMYQFPGYQNSMYPNQFAAPQQHLNPNHMAKSMYNYGAGASQPASKPPNGSESSASTMAAFNNINAAALYNNIYGIYAANGSADEANAIAAAAAAQLQSLGMHPNGVVPNMQHPQFAQLQHFASMTSGGSGGDSSATSLAGGFGNVSGGSKTTAASYDKFTKGASNTPSAQQGVSNAGAGAGDHHHHPHHQHHQHQQSQQSAMNAYSNFGQYSGHQSHPVNNATGNNMQSSNNPNSGFSMRNYWSHN